MKQKRTIRNRKFWRRLLYGAILGSVVFSIVPDEASAIPAFARKYDLSCTSCHTKPPRLNAFGEAFHMAGYQIPGTKDGGTRKKRQIGRIWSETDLLNIFALRAHGNVVESFQGGNPDETNITFPREVEIYLAGTLTDEISYFFDLAYENQVIEADGPMFEEKSEFGLGKEFFLMIDLQPMLKAFIPGGGGEMADMAHGSNGMGHVMVMGPMVMVGKIDPSTNFSYPTNRQIIIDVPGKVDAGFMERFSLTPYAFAAKFFGLQTAEGDAVEVTKAVLYNTPGDIGVDFHMMVKNVMLQAGLQQGLDAGIGDVNQKKDPYVMVRLNFGQQNYTSGSISGLVYWGNDTAMVASGLVNWFRYGLSGNLKYQHLDIYGAIIWDTIRNLPGGLSSSFDRTAYGFTVEADYLATDRLLLSVRYDQLNAGGFVNQKANGKVLTLQARHYIRDNFSVYVRDSINLQRVSANALQNYRNLVALGFDFDF